MAVEMEQGQQQGGQMPDPAEIATELISRDPMWAGAVAEAVLAQLEQQQQGQPQQQGGGVPMAQEGPPPMAEPQRGYNVTPSRGRIAPGGR